MRKIENLRGGVREDKITSSAAKLKRLFDTVIQRVHTFSFISFHKDRV